MDPEPPKREEDLSEAVDSWVEKVRRHEAHGSKYALPPLCKVTALRKLMVGKSKEHFEMWEADHRDDDGGGYQEVLGKVRDYARRRKLDHAVSKTIHSGGDPMDLGGVDEGAGHGECEHGWYQGQGSEGWEYAAAMLKGKGKVGQGKGLFYGSCYNCGQQGRSAKYCPKGKGVKGKGKGGNGNGEYGGNRKGEFQGVCYSCGEYGHSARFCPKGAGGKKGGGKWGGQRDRIGGVLVGVGRWSRRHESWGLIG